MPRVPRFRNKQSGLTLIELVTVIVVLAIVSIGISAFLRKGFEIYAGTTERDQLLSESRFVIERLNRELRKSIPNSLRIKHDLSQEVQCLEFVPAEWVAFYTRIPVFPNTDLRARVVEIAGNTAQFNLQANDYAFVYPTTDADIYASASEKRRSILACSSNIDADNNGLADGDGNCNTIGSSSNVVELTVDDSFQGQSPASRMYFGRKSISFCVNDDTISRHEDTIKTEQTLYLTGGDVMAEKIKNDLSQTTQLPFAMSGATEDRNGLVNIKLAFELNKEQINYNLEVHIPNAP
ncbi:type II secretion system protein J [Paraglaciecola sp.]|uniref:PulJ/GspJ family protein n=1 Tax=Paraglaciecola sp. TaxID=1920173 RepID=UPI00273E24EC|nr:type II secretion system protein [Paraglaciecola sp.]MDP5029677.1 type II secretion system GspH family protein [Paraglaciecola sp.]